MNNKAHDFSVYLDYFRGREEFIGLQVERGYRPISRSLDADILKIHFEGHATFAEYVLNQQSNCNFVCIKTLRVFKDP